MYAAILMDFENILSNREPHTHHMSIYMISQTKYTNIWIQSEN